MQNRFQILNTLSGDEEGTENKPTKFNTKKLKNYFFCARVESACCSSSTLCTSATVSTPSCTTLESTNTISEEPQIPPGGTDQLTQLEIEQELWFLNTLKEYYDKLDLTAFTPKMVQSEVYKNFWRNYFSERLIKHISSLNRYPKYLPA